MPRRWFDWLRWPELGPFADEMRIEEFTDGDSLVVRAEMAGLDPDKDIDIQVSDHTLVVRASRREKTETKEKGSYRSEFRYGSFARSIPLPSSVDKEDVKAAYKDGILEVRVPIDRKEVEAKKIKVERA